MDSREIRDKGQGHVSLDRALASAEARTDHSRTLPNAPLRLTSAKVASYRKYTRAAIARGQSTICVILFSRSGSFIINTPSTLALFLYLNRYKS